MLFRSGIDKIDLKNKEDVSKPSLGFSIQPPIDYLKTSIHYAYIFEPFTPEGTHVLALSFLF